MMENGFNVLDVIGLVIGLVIGVAIGVKQWRAG
jgi:hypothetical protein